eukprot:5495895-Prymnesium_polylepis.1
MAFRRLRERTPCGCPVLLMVGRNCTPFAPLLQEDETETEYNLNHERAVRARRLRRLPMR